MPTKLDKHREHYGCNHDGETVLQSADMGEFSEHRSKYMENRAIPIQESTLEICQALGIKPKMTRKKIIKKLQDYRALGNQAELIEVIKKEARAIRLRIRDLPRSVELLPVSNSENAISEAARVNIMAIIGQIIRFCEDPVAEEE